MDDDELTRLAIKLLEKEGQRFVRERALTKPGPLKANKAFLRATLKHNEISNRRINTKSEAKISRPVEKPNTKFTQDVPTNERKYDIVSTRSHKFNRNCLKKKAQVNKLTKDLKVSFKFQLKGKLTETDSTHGNIEGIHDEDESGMESSENTIEKMGESGTEEKANVINISDTESIISISSTEVAVSKSKRKKFKKNKKDKRKGKRNKDIK